jgi:hypothetical protein
MVTFPSPGLDRLDVRLTRAELKSLPDIDETKPVSRQEETRLQNQRAAVGLAYDGFSNAFMVPTATAEHELDAVRDAALEGCDPHLRSTKAVRRYRVEIFRNDAAGHVEDFVVDASRWRITGLVVRLNPWPRSRHIVIPASNVEDISWLHKTVVTRLPADRVRRKNRATTSRIAKARSRRRDRTFKST